MLGVYGGLDARVNATRDAAQAALEAARVDYEILTFTEADHAFFNDTGARFNPQAAEEAWRRVIDWFDDAATRTASKNRDEVRGGAVHADLRGCGWRRWRAISALVCVEAGRDGSASTRERSSSRVGTRSPVSRSASVPSTPSRIAAQRFSSIRHESCTGSGSPAS